MTTILDNKKIILILLAFMLLLVGCSPKLSKQFYINPEDILLQHQVNYLPNGYKRLEIMSVAYAGQLTIAGVELIFEPSKQNDIHSANVSASSVQIHKIQILNIELFKKRFGRQKAIILQTITKDHCFQMPEADADKIYEIILNWYNKDKNINNFDISEEVKEEEAKEEEKQKSKKIGAAIGGTVGFRNILGRHEGALHGVGGNVFLDKIFFKNLKLSLNAGYDKYVQNITESEVLIRNEGLFTLGIYTIVTDESIYTATGMRPYVGLEIGQGYRNHKYFYSPNYDEDLMQANDKYKGFMIYIVVGCSYMLSKSICLEVNFKTLFIYQNKINVGIGYTF